MKSFIHSIKFKLVLINIIILVVIVSMFYYINFHYTNRIMLSLIDASISHLSNAAKNSLELAMLTEKKENLNAILENICSDPEIRQIFIIDNAQKIKFSSDSSEIGRQVDLFDKSFYQSSTYIQTNYIRSELIKNQQDQYLRNINPIFKKQQCTACHTGKSPILGNLVINFSLEFVESQMASLKYAFIILTIATSIILIILINIVIHKFLLNKLSSIGSAIKAIAKDGFRGRIRIRGKDEIDFLAMSFNDTIDKVNTLMGEVEKDRTYLENLINSVNDGILVLNLDYTIALANRAILEEKGLSLEQVIGHYCYKVKSNQNVPCSIADNQCPLNKIKRTGKPDKSIQMIPSEKNGNRFYEIYASPMKDEQGEVVQIIEVIRDISERKTLEAQLIQSEKLASIGVLTTNVAHEINNPMASITTCVEGLLKRLKTIQFQESESKNIFEEYLQTINNAAFRCKVYTERLLSFSAPSEYVFDFININDILKDVTVLIDHQARSMGKSIVLELSENLPLISGDRTQLAQVFLNLITNGLDAVNIHGKVIVESEKDDKNIRIIVKDNGSGIDENIYEKIFEPFFTTKERGKGTGLGLYISKHVIERHKGSIEVKNHFPHGAEFVIYIPYEISK